MNRKPATKTSFFSLFRISFWIVQSIANKIPTYKFHVMPQTMSTMKRVCMLAAAFKICFIYDFAVFLQNISTSSVRKLYNNNNNHCSKVVG